MTNNDLSKHNPSLFNVDVKRIDKNILTNFSDVLAVEEPLEIRLDFEKNNQREQKSISITMRTPGNDFELACGFLFTEGILTGPEDITEIKHCGPILKHLGHSNVVKITLEKNDKLNLKSLDRHFYTSSSCGVCGKTSIDALKTQNKYSQVNDDQGAVFSKELIPLLPQKLRAAQDVFEATGGLHASAFFSTDGTLISLKEDVGRHNALDKIIGEAFLAKKLPLDQVLLLVSGRVSFELVQKASMAGIRTIAAVGAPSSLALELAREMNMTLIGFVREQRFNIYHGEWRIK
ncbi:MAG: formate dehydrogenase accessory sulfurtransferase FdhD [Bdellovibrio sp.]|nr:formate dehydrogenase accessory sulfurtransferase FdhD [Bdellovibrio sp.]